MFSFFRKKTPPPPVEAQGVSTAQASAADVAQAPAAVSAPLPATMPAPVPAPEATEVGGTAEAAEKKSWLARLKQGLSRTGSSIAGVFGFVKVDEALFEQLEDALLMADCGVAATQKILADLRARVKAERIEDAAAVRAALARVLAEHLRSLERTPQVPAEKPWVVMIAGVNGAGKTTSIGKITHHLSEGGHSVLLAAADTFRAAAREQLAVWGNRNQVSVVSQDGADPGAVVFDAVQSARAKGVDVVIADTAGRLPTQLHLMEELKKIARVCGKALEGAPHERWLVIDGNTGQNAVAQVKAFNEALQLTGLIVTKLDGTAKGGVLAAIASTCPVPVLFIGVGEQLADLQPFSADEFAAALTGA
ncbi:MAG TPA: signal recognition particle-docking protein FtsY [Burkholderiaceae bacterium]|nr:signal recognition particle-docking protein FtsY [Burkholderiaceae bacterium]